MPHKDRQERLAYLRRWKAAGGRHSPEPEAQAGPGLPARGAIAFSTDGARVQCHVCGRWLGSLNTHLRTHGLDADTYREIYGLARTASLWPPALAEKQQQAAVARDQASVVSKYAPPKGRPRGQRPRLGVRIAASEARKGRYTRGGDKTRK